MRVLFDKLFKVGSSWKRIEVIVGDGLIGDVNKFWNI